MDKLFNLINNEEAIFMKMEIVIKYILKVGFQIIITECDGKFLYEEMGTDTDVLAERAYQFLKEYIS